MNLIRWLPTILFRLPKEFAAAAIGAWVDDDGYVGSHLIYAAQRNKELVRDFRKLIRLKFPKIANNITFNEDIAHGKPFYRAYMRSGVLKPFLTEIPLVHPQRIRDLSAAVERQDRKTKADPPGRTRAHICKLLKGDPKTVRELADLLKLGRKTVRNHLYGRLNRKFPELVETSEVKIVGTAKYGAYLYGLS